MNILVEGIDRAGKSTLTKALKDALKFDVHFLGHTKGYQFDRYLKQYANAENIILERGHISEVIYTDLFARETAFTKEQEEILNCIINERFIVIHAHPELALALSRIESHVDELDKNDIALGIEKFSNYFEKHHYSRQFTYQATSFEELNELVKRISLICGV